MEHQEYIEKWLNGTLTEDEKRIFEQTEDYRELARLSKAVQDFSAPEFDVPAEYVRLQKERSRTPHQKEFKIQIPAMLLRAAAVLVILAGSYFFFLYSPETSINTLATQTTELFLPDSSTVMLNAGSKLTYHQKHWNDNRLVSLEGEAFFRVAKGSRFDVKTTSGIITVLGTQFNVNVREEYFEVVCYEGSVRVESPLKEVILQPGMMFRVVKGKLVPVNATKKTAPSWLAKESAFESVPYEEVLKEFERQYNVVITTRSVNIEQLFKGRFTNENISLALKSISIPLNLTYVIDEKRKTVVLSGEDN